ncbi:MAG: hypothetical protein ABSD74_07610 [Rhizomicrobium sp.]|jgi:hypothetical protein
MTNYARWLFGIAALFNCAVGLAMLFLRPLFLGQLGFDAIAGSNIVIANLTGMFIALFGWCYLLVAIDPVKNRPFVAIGAVGKLLAIVCVVTPWLTGAVQMKPPPLLAGDFILALLFLDYLRRTRASAI